MVTRKCHEKKDHRKTQKANGTQKIDMQNLPKPRNVIHRGENPRKDEEVVPDKTCKQANM